MPQALEETYVKPVPSHIAIIMDGNRRWALEKGVSRLAGHQKGIEAARRAVEAALDAGVEYLTLYAFSSENWKRPKDEVDSLMGLLRLYLAKELTRIGKSGVKVRFIGRRDNLPRDIITLMEKAEKARPKDPRLTLIVALNYGSHDEILQAVRVLAKKAVGGEILPEDITEDDLSGALETHGAPDPDMVIRTGGEKRLSNFLLWQSAYAELVFLDAYWPDFNAELLGKAIREFQIRDRRYGART